MGGPSPRREPPSSNTLDLNDKNLRRDMVDDDQRRRRRATALRKSSDKAAEVLN